MPISRREFESNELDPSFVIEEFLRSDSDNAFTIEDLIVELASNRIPLKRNEVESILKSLENDKRIASKIVSLNTKSDVVHYIYCKPI